MRTILIKLFGWIIIPGLSIWLGIQNDPFKNNYSDLQTHPFYSKIFIILVISMACYLFYTLGYLLYKRKYGKWHFVLLGISFIFFLAGNFLPYQPGGEDMLSLRHVDLVLIAIAIYLLLFIRYLGSRYLWLGELKIYLWVVLGGCAFFLMYFQRVNSVLEVWSAIGLSILMERLCNKEKNFDI